MRLPSISIYIGCLAFLVLGIQVSVPGPLAAAEPPGIPSFGIEPSQDLDMVEVDVFVAGGQGAREQVPLSVDDFEIFENGQQVPISSFYAVENGTLRSSSRYGVASRSARKIRPAHPRYVFVVDWLHLNPAHRQSMLDELAEFVRRDLRRGDQAMVVSHDGDLRIEQRLTDDLEQVAETLEALEGRAAKRKDSLAAAREDILARIHAVAVPSSLPLKAADSAEMVELISQARGLLDAIEQYAQRNAADTFRTLDRLQSFFGTLAGISGRKSVIFISDGLPLRPGETIYKAWETKFSFLTDWRDTSRRHGDVADRVIETFFDRGNLFSATVGETGNFNASWAFSELGNKASEHRIAWYGLYPGTMSTASQEQNGTRAAALAEASTHTWMESMARATGGFVTGQGMSLEQGLRRLRQDSRSHYTFGFFPRPSKDSTIERRIEIQAERPGLEVRHRQRYATRSRLEVMHDRTLASLVHETTENPLGVAVDLSTVHLDERGHQRLPMLVKIPVENLMLLPVEDHYEGRISIHVGARDATGQMSPIEAMQVEIRVPSHHLEATEGQTRVFGHHLMLEMRPGDHWVAIGVRDEVGNTESTALVRHLDEASLETSRTLARRPEP